MGMDLFEQGGRAFGGWLGARKSERQAKKARQEQMRLIDELDWEPEYASDHVQAYKKTNSPVARAYLESTLGGFNPDTTWDGDTNAQYKRAAQQRTKDNVYGTSAELAAKSQAAQQETYAPTPIDRPVARDSTLGLTSSPDDYGKEYSAVHGALMKQGLTDVRARNAEVQKLIAKYGSIDVVADQLRAGRI